MWTIAPPGLLDPRRHPPGRAPRPSRRRRSQRPSPPRYPSRRSPRRCSRARGSRRAPRGRRPGSPRAPPDRRCRRSPRAPCRRARAARPPCAPARRPRAQIATLAPSRAKPRAMARPMPRLARRSRSHPCPPARDPWRPPSETGTRMVHDRAARCQRAAAARPTSRAPRGSSRSSGARRRPTVEVLPVVREEPRGAAVEHDERLNRPRGRAPPLAA